MVISGKLCAQRILAVVTKNYMLRENCYYSVTNGLIYFAPV
jgi:hypothetical protein